jgi:hypothetical protein
MMSTEEQDLLLGRLTRECRESEREIAGLEARIALFFESVKKVQGYYNGIKPPGKCWTVTDALKALAEVPPSGQLEDDLKAWGAERQRHAELSERLRAIS